MVCSEFEEKGQGCFSANDRPEFMKGTMISAAEQVCVRTKGPKDTRKIGGRKKRSQSEKPLFRKRFKTRTHELWKKCKESRQYAKKVVSHAKERKMRELAGDLDIKVPTPDLQNCKADG